MCEHTGKAITTNLMILPVLSIEVITSAPDAMSRHLVLREMSEAAQMLRQVRKMLLEGNRG
jgi:hypothetical protein